LLRVLPHYYEHVDTYEECTIARIFCIFSVNIDMFEPIHVMIMQNTMPNVPNTDLHYVFDMKGSSINREMLKAKDNTTLKKSEPTGGMVLKDLDYLRLKELKHFMDIDNETL